MKKPTLLEIIISILIPVVLIALIVVHENQKTVIAPVKIADIVKVVKAAPEVVVVSPVKVAQPIVVAPVKVTPAPTVVPTVTPTTPSVAPVHTVSHLGSYLNHGNFVHGNSNPAWTYHAGHNR
jgi:hypothetical protein